MRKAIFGILVVLGFLACKTAWAETYVNGTLSTNTTWNMAGSPYIVTDTVYVANGVRLTIEPGVVVKFATETSLISYGTLSAVGTSIATITFTSSQTTATAGDWKGIKLSGSGANGSQIRYCEIMYAVVALYSEYTSNIRIMYNYVHDNKGSGGLADYHGQLGEMGCGIYLSFSNNNTIASNTISNNTGGKGGTATGTWGSGGKGGSGVGIYLHQIRENIISGNIISQNKGGTGGDGVGGGGGEGGIGCGIYMYSATASTISTNVISNNTGGEGGIWRFGGTGGIGCGIYISFSAENIIFENTICNNVGGKGGNAA
ncbi:right-handed parallel beta-helix repeat-containing protein, partial [bacterium]|nr:right-handed parallel beta-helix repeat-containing protein [bacterium]